jgi:RHS repeat-associated protein
VLNLTYDYGITGVTYPFVQTYTYDELNRLASATETYNGSQNWKQEFSYNRYGNRSFVTGSGHTDTLAGCTSMCNPSFGSTTNRITSSGYSFDSSGNTTADPASRSFVYDAENKQTSVTSGGSTVGTYYYDGDGKRVKKTTSTSDNTVFACDAAGKLVEEYPTSALTTAATAYVYAGARLLSTETSSGTTYLTADHLGSPRINTDGGGNVVARHDYMPFGEDIATSQRTSSVGYISDSVRKRFTQKERDNETSLDYFIARYYSSTQGRFTSSDPLMASGRTWTPQSWNCYSYVLNNPLRLIDPTGLVDDDPQDPKKQNEQPKPIAVDQITVGGVTVKVEQMNEPAGFQKVINGTERVGVGVQLDFTVTDGNGKPLEGATAVEKVKALEGPEVKQNAESVPLDSQVEHQIL